MNSVSEAEAQVLLAQKLRCEDYGRWQLTPGIPNAYYLACGLLTESGENARLLIDIMAKVSVKTGIHHHTFTVFRPRPFSARVYQLEIRTCPKALRDKHQRPHEHIGDVRRELDNKMEWSFGNALKYFTDRTGIKFVPELNDPFEFNLELS